jgi:phenylacetic acid degradation operon negative regulatory protein
MPVRALTAAGELFGIEPGSIRVALARLCRRGLVENGDRGSYRLGPAATAVTTRIRSWRLAESQTTSWNGDWLMVARSDDGNRNRNRRSQRALDLFGFMEFRTGVWIRPDNLRGSVNAARQALLELELDETSVVGILTALAPADRSDAEELWEPLELEDRYRNTLRTLDESLARTARQTFEQSLAETYLVGSEGVHTVVFDPMLPAPLVDVTTRRARLEALLAYDRLGRKLWGTFMARYDVSTDASPLEASTQLSPLPTTEN